MQTALSACCMIMFPGPTQIRSSVVAVEEKNRGVLLIMHTVLVKFIIS
jgi:hypothetical protein